MKGTEKFSAVCSHLQQISTRICNKWTLLSVRYAEYTVRSLMKLNGTVTYRLPAGIAMIQACWFSCSCGVILESYPENVEALGGWSCSSSRKPGSDSCIQLYHLTLCIITHLQILYWIGILLYSLVFLHSSKETNWFVRCSVLNYPKRYLCGTMLEEKIMLSYF